MKLRDKIDSIDREIAMLRKSVWFLMRKLDVEPADIIRANDEMKKQEEIAELEEKAKRLGLKVSK